MDPLSRQKPGQCPPNAAPSGGQTQAEQVGGQAQSLLGQLINSNGDQVAQEADQAEPVDSLGLTVTSTLASLASAASISHHHYPSVATKPGTSEFVANNGTFYLELANDSEKTATHFIATSTTTTSPSQYGTDVDTYQLEALDERSQLFLSVLYTLTAITSFILNIITVIVLARCGRSELRKYLINLSMSDLLMSLFSIPFTYTEYMLGRWIFPAPLCPVVRFVVTLSVFVSAATMTVIGINRHLAIIYPFKKKKFSRFRGWTVRQTHVIVAIWLVGIVISMPEYLMFSVKQFCHEGTFYNDCRQLWPESISHSYAIFIYFCTFAIPLSLLTYLYGCIGLKLWRRQMPGNVDPNRDLTMQTMSWKVIKMLAVVVFVFAVSWLPLQTFSMVLYLYPEVRQHVEYQSLEYNIFVCTYFACHWLSMAHSCLNPLIYCFMNDKFRSDLQALICKRDKNYLPNTSHRSLVSRKASQLVFGQLSASGSGGQQAAGVGGGATLLQKCSTPGSRPQCSGGATAAVVVAAAAKPLARSSPEGNSATRGAQPAAAGAAAAAEAAAVVTINAPAAGCDGRPSAQLANCTASPAAGGGSQSAGSPEPSETLKQFVELAERLEFERQVGETLFVKVLRQQSGRQQLFVYESSLEASADGARIKGTEEEDSNDDDDHEEGGERKSDRKSDNKPARRPVIEEV